MKKEPIKEDFNTEINLDFFIGLMSCMKSDDAKQMLKTKLTNRPFTEVIEGELVVILKTKP